MSLLTFSAICSQVSLPDPRALAGVDVGVKAGVAEFGAAEFSRTGKLVQFLEWKLTKVKLQRL